MRRTTRREALRMMAAGTAGALVLPTMACTEASESVAALVTPSDAGAFSLPELPYGLAALEPIIDTQTMGIHHGKHHQGYVNKLNAALDGASDLKGKPLEDLLSDLETVPTAIRTAIRDSGGGHLNHSLFWKMMSPDGGGEPSGALSEAIARDFGTFEALKEAFQKSATGVFGSGWGWLVSDTAGILTVVGTPNQDTPLSNGLHPVLGIDVWEHAYYLHYQNRRADYVAAFWDLVNWNTCADLYQRALG